MRRGRATGAPPPVSGADARAPLSSASPPGSRCAREGRWPAMRVWLTGGSGFVGRHLVEAFDDVLAPSHAEVDVTDAEAVRRSVDAFEPDVLVHAAILNDFSRLEREGWAAYVGRDAQRRGGGRRRARDPRLDRLGLRRDRRVGRDDAAEPDQPLRDAQGGERAGGRHGRAHLGRAGRVRTRRAARTPASATSSPRSCARCARASGSRSGRVREINSIATPTLASDAAAPDRPHRRGRPPRRLPLLRRRVGRRGASWRCGPSRCSGSTATCSSSGRRRDPGFPVPYDTRLDATATAAALGVELPSLDDQLRRLERSLTCTT